MPPQQQSPPHKAAPAAPAAAWDATLSQTQFMERDTVLTLSNADAVVGSATKFDAHVFSPAQPRGVLHRAFSVFLFDASTNELLLQQRASTKVTFPNVWTNTCCSHPLHGMAADEVDGPNDVADGTVRGTKRAAIRKLDHELGIPQGTLKVEEFKFLTRMHYWAADTVTHGKKSPWGEHEIDYILFVTVPSKDALALAPHPEEVDAVEWVTPARLRDMFADDALLFSPWFRLIATKWMMGSGEKGADPGWWDDLDRAMTTDACCDYGTIHRFDPPAEHMGGAGDAGPLFNGNTDGTAAACVGDSA